jgi:hypothetical protein
MTLTKTVNLLLRCTNSNPYGGMLSIIDNYTAAIDLAKLFREFAEGGQVEEAMNLNVEHWNKAINKLESNPVIKGVTFKKIK